MFVVALAPGAASMHPGAQAVQASDPTVAAASFSATGNLGAPRSGHTATLLPNGKVLIAGGNNGFANLNTAELYDPATGAFTAAGTMTETRSGHTATPLPNGKVLIAGGFGGPALDTAELYDPATGMFSGTGLMTAARAYHTATLLPNGAVLLAGGTAGLALVNTNELYDGGVFTPAGNLAAARENHTATLLPSGKVLIAGGDDLNVPLNTTELYDSGTSTAIGNMTAARFRHTATLLPNGHVLIAGGGSTLLGASLSTAELYIPDKNGFTATGTTMNAARQDHTATLLPNGMVLIAGGAGNGASSAPLNTAERYDPTPGTFTATVTMAAARWNQTATLLPGGSVLIAGGKNPAALNTAELYEFANGTFTATGTMTDTRSQYTATLLPNGKVLIAGGVACCSSAAALNTAQIYDPATETFTATTGAMTTARHYHTATLLPNGAVLIAGGFNGSSGSLNTAELYDPATGTFTAITATMIAARWNHTATLLPNGQVLIAGGYDSAALNTAELYDPATGAFAAAGTVTDTQSQFTATLLVDGKVLIAGGDDAGAALNTAQIYDPATGTFTGTVAMTAARSYHTATLLPNGKVLIAGGFNGSSGYLNTAELYERATGTFTAITATMTAARSYHTATLLPNGKVLLAGGYRSASGLPGDLNTAELYDPGTRTFTATTMTMTAARRYHTATLLPSGEVLIAGGRNGSGILDTAELYDVGLGYTDARRPVVVSDPATLVQPAAITLTGSGFRGDSEASGGSVNSSPTNYPLLQLQRVDNDQIVFVNASAWSDTGFTSTALSTLADGPYRVTIFTNGIPSVQRVILVTGFAPPAVPTLLSATATSASQVALTWSPVSAATSYEVYRSASLSGPYTLAVSTTETSENDTGLSANTTYLYKVLAIGSGGSSAFTAIDPATTVVFDDASLSGVAIKAVHVTQLRTAVNAMRAAAELLPFAFTAPAPSAGTPILRQHMIDLRTALDVARSTLGLPVIGYTDQVITAGTTVIQAAHITELRARTQ